MTPPTAPHPDSSSDNISINRVEKRDAPSDNTPDSDRESIGQTPNTAAPWIYDQKLKRRNECRFTGYVFDAHGPEADRLRSELAEVIRALLEWAAGHQHGTQLIEEDEAA